MDHFTHVYTYQAAAYHQMIDSEDADGNLRTALARMLPEPPIHILDLGTGTGRIPQMLAGEGAQVTALDLSTAMLRENLAQRRGSFYPWDLICSDMRLLPLQSASFDFSIAAWSIGHLRAWFAADWQAEIARIIDEMLRVTRHDRQLVILETLGTGSLEPFPPTQELAEYYAWLENEWGFTRKVIATDYQFPDVETAVSKTEFFFGHALTEKIRKFGWARLPEWTGIWSRTV